MTIARECWRSAWRRCSKPAFVLLAGSVLAVLFLIFKGSQSVIQMGAIMPYVKGDPSFHEEKNTSDQKAMYAHLQGQHQNDLQTISELVRQVADLSRLSGTAIEDTNGTLDSTTENTAYTAGNSLKVGLRTDPVVLCIPCLNFEEARDVAILMKSILLNTKSWMYVWFFAPRDVNRTLNVLFQSWDIAQIAGFRVDTISDTDISTDSLNEKCLAVIKKKFLFLSPKLIFAEDIAQLWAANDAMIPMLKNSSAVYNLAEKDSEHFPPDLLNSVYSINGDAFRSRNEHTELMDKNPRETKDPCGFFKRGASLPRRRHICFYCYPGIISNKTNDVTLFTQLTFERLNALTKVLENWEGPASIALHLSDWEAQELLKMIERGALPGKRANVQYHVVYKRGKLYPTNVLRNVALKEVQTKYLFVLDVDLVPQPGLHSIILSRLPLDEKRALVVPAFETQSQSYTVPASKEELLEDFQQKKVRQFYYSIFPKGHAPVNYMRWIHATSEYSIKYQPGFEPYVVLARTGAPQFAEVLMDRLRNKIEFMYHLSKLGYQYAVLSDGFIVHLPHPTWNSGSENERTHLCRDLLVKELHKEWVVPRWVKKNLAKWKSQHST